METTGKSRVCFGLVFFLLLNLVLVLSASAAETEEERELKLKLDVKDDLGPFCVVVTSRALIYSEPDWDSKMAGVYDKGAVVKVLEKTTHGSDPWYRTDAGWIPAIFAQTLPTTYC